MQPNKLRGNDKARPSFLFASRSITTGPASKVTQDKDILEQFLQDEVLPFIGIQVSSAGVKRESELSLTPQCPPVVFTNGMLIELDKLRNKERLRAAWPKDAVYAVSGHLVERKKRKNLTGKKDTVEVYSEGRENIATKFETVAVTGNIIKDY